MYWFVLAMFIYMGLAFVVNVVAAVICAMIKNRVLRPTVDAIISLAFMVWAFVLLTK